LNVFDRPADILLFKCHMKMSSSHTFVQYICQLTNMLLYHTIDTIRWTLQCIYQENCVKFKTILNWWKEKPAGSIACTRKQQPRFHWSWSQTYVPYVKSLKITTYQERMIKFNINGKCLLKVINGFVTRVILLFNG